MPQPYNDSSLNVLNQGACVSIFDLGLSELKVPNPTADLLKQMMANPTLPSGPQDAFPQGNVMFNSNQVVFSGALPVTGQIELPRLGTINYSIVASVLISSLDDISLSANQFRTEISGPVEFAHVTTFAPTIRGTSNRFGEALFTCLASYFSAASLLNVTTGNEATHLFLVGAGYKNQSANNITLI